MLSETCWGGRGGERGKGKWSDRLRLPCPGGVCDGDGRRSGEERRKKGKKEKKIVPPHEIASNCSFAHASAKRLPFTKDGKREKGGFPRIRNDFGPAQRENRNRRASHGGGKKEKKKGRCTHGRLNHYDAGFAELTARGKGGKSKWLDRTRPEVLLAIHGAE